MPTSRSSRSSARCARVRLSGPGRDACPRRERPLADRLRGGRRPRDAPELRPDGRRLEHRRDGERRHLLGRPRPDGPDAPLARPRHLRDSRVDARVGVPHRASRPSRARASRRRAISGASRRPSRRATGARSPSTRSGTSRTSPQFFAGEPCPYVDSLLIPAATAIREADPFAKIAAPELSGSWGSSARSPSAFFDAIALRNAADLVDIVSQHVYEETLAAGGRTGSSTSSSTATSSTARSSTGSTGASSPSRESGSRSSASPAAAIRAAGTTCGASSSCSPPRPARHGPLRLRARRLRRLWDARPRPPADGPLVETGRRPARASTSRTSIRRLRPSATVSTDPGARSSGAGCSRTAARRSGTATSRTPSRTSAPRSQDLVVTDFEISSTVRITDDLGNASQLGRASRADARRRRRRRRRAATSPSSGRTATSASSARRAASTSSHAPGATRRRPPCASRSAARATASPSSVDGVEFLVARDATFASGTRRPPEPRARRARGRRREDLARPGRPAVRPRRDARSVRPRQAAGALESGRSPPSARSCACARSNRMEES